MEKHPPREKDIHHRQNRACGKTRAYPIRVNKRLYAFFHALFGHKDVYQIAQDLNDRWISPEYILKVERRKPQ